MLKVKLHLLGARCRYAQAGGFCLWSKSTLPHPLRREHARGPSWLPSWRSAQECSDEQGRLKDACETEQLRLPRTARSTVGKPVNYQQTFPHDQRGHLAGKRTNNRRGGALQPPTVWRLQERRRKGEDRGEEKEGEKRRERGRGRGGTCGANNRLRSRRKDAGADT